MTAANIVYKTFGSQWVIEYLSSYQNMLYIDRKSLRNAKRFIYVTVMFVEKLYKNVLY
jgi:hypothetical protein